MSGGGIGHQSGEDDHQVVIFTFTGQLKRADVAAWNAAVGDLLKKFGGKLSGVTLSGAKGPKSAKRKQKRKTSPRR